MADSKLNALGLNKLSLDQINAIKSTDPTNVELYNNNGALSINIAGILSTLSTSGLKIAGELPYEIEFTSTTQIDAAFPNASIGDIYLQNNNNAYYVTDTNLNLWPVCLIRLDPNIEPNKKWAIFTNKRLSSYTAIIINYFS